MKLFTIKRILGLGAIYGVVQYARKQGGFRPMLDGLMNKVNELKSNVGAQGESSTGAAPLPSANEYTAESTSTAGTTGTSGYGSSYGGGTYGGGGSFGGGNNNRH